MSEVAQAPQQQADVIGVIPAESTRKNTAIYCHINNTGSDGAVCTPTRGCA